MIPQSSPPPTTSGRQASRDVVPDSKVRKTVKNGIINESKKRNTIKQGKSKSAECYEENLVQWKQKNIKNGFVVVDEEQLSKLIKREPIEKYYKLDPEPFAKGLFASVTRCRSLDTNELFAAKFTNKKRYGEDCSEEIYHEIALLSICAQAPRIVQIHDIFETKTDIILVMEYAPGGDLQTIIDENLVPFESTVNNFIKQTVEGLDYLHRRKIAHLDIKPQNIVMMGDFPDCDVKLCDFEISRVTLDGTEIREILGTPDYVAPEILHYEPITLAADMWSLGVTTYVLLSGFSPFGGETDQETFCNISRGELDLPEELFEDVSPEALDFLKALLVKDPKERMSAADCLRHPWLQKFSRRKPKESVPPQPLLRHDSDPITAEKFETKTSPQPKNQKSLRKYLSKSREALFEKVVQQHKNVNNLRKSTLKNQLLNRSRLYESQMSLVSKSREKLLNGENMGPSFSRSIEKIYGLRSLSKSQEVLNLYKSGGILASQDNLNLVSEMIIKSRENLNVDTHESCKDKRITRATTADIGVLRARHRHFRMYSGSSTTSISSSIGDIDLAEDEECEEDSISKGILEDLLLKAKEICIKDEDKDEKEKITVEPESIASNDCSERVKGKEEVRKLKDITKEKAESLQEQFEKISKKLERVKSGEEEIDEPRFTVAQLISAYNKHQEIVTKTSLEVTMTAQAKEEKIPPRIEYKANSLFPTGPLALRLFIPDIDLVELPKRKIPTYKIRFAEDKSDSSGPNSGEWKDIEVDKSEEDPKKKEEDFSLKYLRSCSLSSEASTTISTEGSVTTAGSSCEELNGTRPDPKKFIPLPLNTNNNDYSKSSLENLNVDFDKLKEKWDKSPDTPDVETNVTLNVKGRSKSTSPSPTVSVKEEKVRKLSAGSNLEPKIILKKEKSPKTTRKLVEKPKVPVDKQSRKPSVPKPKTDLGNPRRTTTDSNSFKIIGITERTPSPNKRNIAGISYKIEFDSPIVPRKFPSRPRTDLSTRTTVSSELKKQDSTRKGKK